MKKVGKTTRPFRYDLNEIPYDYTVEVTNRFKRFVLIDKVPEELWAEVHDIVQEAVIKTIPKKKKCQKAKWFSEKVLQIAEKRIEVKCQSRFDARCWMLGAGALGRPRGMEWGGRREEGSGWGTHVHLW